MIEDRIRKLPRALAARVPTENEEMIFLTYFLRRTKLLWAHIPNEGKRSYAAGRLAKKIGLAPGVPDIIIFTQTPDGKPGMAIELKRLKNARVSTNQENWIKALTYEGWSAGIYYGAQAAIRAISKEYAL